MVAVICAATRWRTNAELIRDCARLGYLQSDWLTLDPTFGKGTWWRLWRPDELVTCNRNVDGTDFRCLPWSDGKFDAIAYDPPFVSVGGRATTTIPGFQQSYGMDDAPRTPALLQKLCNDGLTEMFRLVRPSGIVLVKSQDYVSSGKLWIGTHHTLTHALALGFTVRDRLEMITSPRPQPENRTRQDGKAVVQQHARRNLSTLFVFRKR